MRSEAWKYETASTYAEILLSLIRSFAYSYLYKTNKNENNENNHVN